MKPKQKAKDIIKYVESKNISTNIDLAIFYVKILVKMNPQLNIQYYNEVIKELNKMKNDN